jgi:predicted AlkP superfamily pyrophosphatase or phosphodiesterase
MKIAFSLAVALSLAYSSYCQDTVQIVNSESKNAAEQFKKHYVVLISADGFRYDLAEKYHASHLLKLAKKGVKAAYMQPSFPSLTFPNHYSIATGLYPAHHGLVDNSIYDKLRNEYYTIRNTKAVSDSFWYGGTPIWVLAEQQNMLSASFYWVGSEAPEKGFRPTYYYKYNEKINIDRRIDEVKKWLQLPEERRPHLITFYFPEVDHAEHKYGVESEETRAAVQFIDSSIEQLTKTLGALQLDIDYIFVSDHGMLNVDVKNPLALPQSVDTAKFRVIPGSSLIHLYAKNTADIEPTYNAIKKEAIDFDLFRASEMPAKWHYGATDDKYNRIGDILLVPHPPRFFNFGNRTPQLGHHGFDPEMTEMRATFYAWGPDFKKHMYIPGFENVHVYPLIAKILGLKYSFAIDGDIEVLGKTLK